MVQLGLQIGLLHLQVNCFRAQAYAAGDLTVECLEECFRSTCSGAGSGYGKAVGSAAYGDPKALLYLLEVGIELPTQTGEMARVVGFQGQLEVEIGRTVFVLFGGRATGIQRLFGRSFVCWEGDDTDPDAGVNRLFAITVFTPATRRATNWVTRRVL